MRASRTKAQALSGQGHWGRCGGHTGGYDCLGGAVRHWTRQTSLNLPCLTCKALIKQCDDIPYFDTGDCVGMRAGSTEHRTLNSFTAQYILNSARLAPLYFSSSALLGEPAHREVRGPHVDVSQCVASFTEGGVLPKQVSCQLNF